MRISLIATVVTGLSGASAADAASFDCTAAKADDGAHFPQFGDFALKVGLLDGAAEVGAAV